MIKFTTNLDHLLVDKNGVIRHNMSGDHLRKEKNKSKTCQTLLYRLNGIDVTGK